MHTNINYYATTRDMMHADSKTDASYTAPDNDRKVCSAPARQSCRHAL